MQAGLLQLMALLTNHNGEASEDEDEDEDEGFELRNDERAQEEAHLDEEELREWEQSQAIEAAHDLQDRELIAEMLRSDDEDEVAVVGGRVPYAPSLDDEDEDEWEDEEDGA